MKVPALVGGMVAGAESIDDMDLLRHGGMSRPFDGVRAPSALGTFLRSFTFGHVRQRDAVHSRLLINLARQAPLLPGAHEMAFWTWTTRSSRPTTTPSKPTCRRCRRPSFQA